MKKLLKGMVAAAAVAMSMGAMAQQHYLSVAGGQSDADIDCTGVTNCDNNGTAFKLVGGHDFGNGFALELGYIDFGKASAQDGPFDLSFKSKAYTFGGAYQLKFTPDFAANLRVGVANVKSKFSVSSPFGSGSVSDSATKPYFGVGLSYSFASNIAAEIGADFTEGEIEGEKADLRAITVGVRFRF